MDNRFPPTPGITKALNRLTRGYDCSSKPSDRYSGNVAEAIQELNMDGYAAFVTADGLLSFRREYAAETSAALADRDFYCETPRLFPIVAGRVDLGAVAAFIGH